MGRKKKKSNPFFVIPRREAVKLAISFISILILIPVIVLNSSSRKAETLSVKEQIKLNPEVAWESKALLVSREKQAVGIYRMLECGSVGAFDLLQTELEPPVAAEVITKIVRFNFDKAHSTLESYGIPLSLINSTLELSHCSPHRSKIIVTSKEIANDAPAWTALATWDYKGNYNSYRYYSLSPCSWKSETILSCPFNSTEFLVDLNLLKAFDKKGNSPESLILYKNSSGYIQINYLEKTLNYSLALIPLPNGQYNALFLDTPLALSIFTKLHFFNGAGLECFTPVVIDSPSAYREEIISKFVKENADFTQTNLRLWRVNFDCAE